MIEKDYILRLIQTLLDAIKRIIQGIDQGDVEQARIEINKAYELLGRPATFFYKATFDELINYLNAKDNYHLKKIDSLAQLMFINAKIEMSQEAKCLMLLKAKKLWKYYDEHSREYSFERARNISYIDNSLKKFSLQ